MDNFFSIYCEDPALSNQSNQATIGLLKQTTGLIIKNVYPVFFMYLFLEKNTIVSNCN